MKQLTGYIFLIIVFLNLSLSAQTNVALSKPVTVSTVQSGNIASNAVDGNTSTRWCASSGSAPQWLMVDLGGSYSISRTEVMWEMTTAYKYKIETSSDNITWTQRVDRTANTTSQQTFIDNFAVTARYVRITATGLPSGSWASIFEFRVLGTSATTAPVITTQPANLTVTEGQSAIFRIAATGNPAPGYQWRRNGANISGATSTSYTIYSAAMTDSGAVFSCVVSNSAGSVTSSNAVLTVQRDLRRQDSLALVAIYNSTEGPNWYILYNWNTSQPIDTWYGVRVVANRVEKLSLESALLVGVLPREIGNLTAIDSLNISGSISLVNPIPNELGNLKNLVYLRLYGNGFSDSIPSAIGTLPKLKYLEFSGRLTCNIPLWICNMTTLEYLGLYGNAFSGTIPTEIGNLTALTFLNLTGYDYTVHGLSGSVPSSIGNLKRLTFLAVGNNSLTSIPDTIMTLPNLTSGYFTNNRLCNLSPALISWLNARDPFWYANQTCSKPEIQVIATPLSGAVPLNVAFTASNIGSSSIETWSWNFGDGGTALSQNPSHTYTSAGTFVARLIGTGIGGSDTVSVIIQVTNPPVIITPPHSLDVIQGYAATFNVEASGATPLSYQWYKNGLIISGATASIYTKSNVQQVDTGSYTVRVSNSFGSVTSNAARLNVIIPPTIITQPVSQTVFPGTSVTFSVVASGTGPLTYHWSKNWIGIPGATDTSYTISSVQLADSGGYTVVVTNSAGSVTGGIAQLFVIDATLRRQDSLALIALYNSTGGPNWTNKTNWLTAQPIDTWYGVTVVGGRVDELRLNENGLTGSLPNELSNLSALRYLIIANNRGLQGHVPTGIGNMTKLESLLLFSNQLSGPIPNEIGNLTNLALLMLHDNNLSDTIPYALGSLPNIETMYLGTNRLIGLIPSIFGELTKLKDLSLSFNLLSGQIPSKIGDIMTLTNLDLQYNQLSGQVPAHIGNLTNLTLLNIEHNSFTDLPDSIANLTNITGCNIGQNQFCNISSRAVGWANIYDPDWASTQTCTIPDIQITATPLSGPPPLTVAFTATNIGSTMIENWNWSFGDGSSATIQNPSHIYSSGGTFNARLIAKGIGNSGFDTAVIPILVDTPPSITTQPASQSIQQGGDVTFSVAAIGTAPLSYQWYKNGTIISEANSYSYSITNVQSADSGNYSVVVRNNAGSVTSSMARLTVTPLPQPPVITRDPESQTVSSGGRVNFSVTATGTQPFSYVWQKNGVVVGGNTSTFVISTVSFDDSGSYSVIVSNSLGSDTSAAAKLTVVSDSLRPTNQLVSIRGMLYDTSGTPIGGSTADTIEATVRLYDSLIGGALQYTELFRKTDRHQIAVKSGTFTINLGQGTTADSLSRVFARNANLWVEITVDGPSPDVLLPRLPLTASPYSLSRVQDNFDE